MGGMDGAKTAITTTGAINSIAANTIKGESIIGIKPKLMSGRRKWTKFPSTHKMQGSSSWKALI